jgi:hypothetical protein
MKLTTQVYPLSDKKGNNFKEHFDISVEYDEWDNEVKEIYHVHAVNEKGQFVDVERLLDRFNILDKLIDSIAWQAEYSEHRESLNSY